jgi:hypothetical protein
MSQHEHHQGLACQSDFFTLRQHLNSLSSGATQPQYGQYNLELQHVTSQNFHFGMWAIFQMKFKFSQEFCLFSFEIILFEFIFNLKWVYTDKRFIWHSKFIRLGCQFFQTKSIVSKNLLKRIFLSQPSFKKDLQKFIKNSLPNRIKVPAPIHFLISTATKVFLYQ